MARRTFDAFPASMPLLLISLLLPLACFADSSCYNPDGRLASNDRPCTDNGQGSFCCGQGDACMSNNLCHAAGNSDLILYRGSCTDKDWTSSFCPPLCMDSGQNQPSGGLDYIVKCPDDVYVCVNATFLEYSFTSGDCDKDPNAPINPAQANPTTMTIIGVESTSSTKSTSATTPPPPSSTPKVQSSDSNSSSSVITNPTLTPVVSSPRAKSPNGAVIGGAVGGALGGVAVIGIVAWLLISRRKSRQQEHEEQQQQQQQQLTGPLYEADSGDAFAVAKNSAAVHEVHEAPGWSLGQQPPQYHAEVHEVE